MLPAILPPGVALILAFGMVSAAAEGLEAGSEIQIKGDGSMGVGGAATDSGPVPMPAIRPPGGTVFGRDRDRDRDRDWDRDWDRDREDDLDESRLRGVDEDEDRRRKRRKPDRRPFLFFDDDDEEERIIVVPAPPAKPEEPEEVAPVELPAPPDPRGPRFVPARGTAGARPYTIGEPLPQGVPFVTLDWDQYGLPEPPPGLIHARVGSDVLLIDPATRRVERRVDPAGPATAQGARAPAPE